MPDLKYTQTEEQRADLAKNVIACEMARRNTIETREQLLFWRHALRILSTLDLILVPFIVYYEPWGPVCMILLITGVFGWSFSLWEASRTRRIDAELNYEKLASPDTIPPEEWDQAGLTFHPLNPHTNKETK